MCNFIKHNAQLKVIHIIKLQWTVIWVLLKMTAFKHLMYLGSHQFEPFGVDAVHCNNLTRKQGVLFDLRQTQHDLLPWGSLHRPLQDDGLRVQTTAAGIAADSPDNRYRFLQTENFSEFALKFVDIFTYLQKWAVLQQIDHIFFSIFLSTIYH